MNIPKYVQCLMKRSQYEFDRRYYDKFPDSYAAGYTIRIEKRSEYCQIDTLKAEIDRLKAFVDRQTGGEAIVLETPKETHYCQQYAVITIFDPVMKYIESYIPSEEDWKKSHRKYKSPF